MDTGCRPKDAHDVSATYRIVSDPELSLKVPSSGEELLDMLMGYHRTLMAARPEKRPGEFKVEPNFAGGYEFVRPEAWRGRCCRDLNDSPASPTRFTVQLGQWLF